MHGIMFSEGELLSIIALTVLFTWVCAAYWTKRRLRNSLAPNGDVEAKRLEPLQQENRDLRALVEKQEDRIRALETIATDPSERTARAIEALR